MKPKTFFRVALLIPYALWVISLSVYLLPLQDISSTLNALLFPIIYYAFGIILWFIPYTLLALGLWIWSKQKSMEDIYKAAIRSPLLLLILMFLESIIISISAGGIEEILKSAFEASLLLGGFSLVFGYLCVGVALGIYKLLRSKNLIKEEAGVNDELLPSDT